MAKFMSRYDSSYVVTEVHPEFSSYTLNLPDNMNIFSTFHISKLVQYHTNDPTLFPTRKHPRPGLVVTEDSQQEHVIEKILDEH